MEKGAPFPPSTLMAAFVPLCYIPYLMGTGFQVPLDCARLTPPRAPGFIHSFVIRVDALAGGDSGVVHGPRNPMITSVGLCGDLPHSELGLVMTMGEEVDKNQAADASTVCPVHGPCVTQFPCVPRLVTTSPPWSASIREVFWRRG